MLKLVKGILKEERRGKAPPIHFSFNFWISDINYMKLFSITSIFLISAFRIGLLLGKVTTDAFNQKNDSYLYLVCAHKTEEGYREHEYPINKEFESRWYLTTSVSYNPMTNWFKLL